MKQFVIDEKFFQMLQAVELSQHRLVVDFFLHYKNVDSKIIQIYCISNTLVRSFLVHAPCLCGEEFL